MSARLETRASKKQTGHLLPGCPSKPSGNNSDKVENIVEKIEIYTSSLFFVRFSSFRGVAVITFASHAKGPRFDPGRKQIFFYLSLMYVFLAQKHFNIYKWICTCCCWLQTVQGNKITFSKLWHGVDQYVLYFVHLRTKIQINSLLILWGKLHVACALNF